MLVSPHFQAYLTATMMHAVTAPTDRSSVDGAFAFARTELAQTLADEMLGLRAVSALAPLPASGTFLSAPRRVGKSTFLRKDLLPLLKECGIEVVYVDLWEDRSRDPAQLLQLAVQRALDQHAGLLAKTAKVAHESGLARVSAMRMVTFELGKSNADGTLTDALLQLAQRAKAGKVALIIDEAQQALATEAGETAMFALKAARDALNVAPSEPRLILLCTGSSRSKLSALVSGKESPFFGAAVRDYPVLGVGFTEAYTAFVNARLQPEVQMSAEAMQQAFALVSHRPESLFVATGNAVSRTVLAAGAMAAGDDTATVKTMDAALLHEARATQGAALGVLQDQFDVLTPNQQAIFIHLMGVTVAKQRFTPFGKVSLGKYAEYVGDKVSATAAQSALDALVDKELVWQAQRGGYALDDPMWLDWFVARQPAGR